MTSNPAIQFLAFFFFWFWFSFLRNSVPPMFLAALSQLVTWSNWSVADGLLIHLRIFLSFHRYENVLFKIFMYINSRKFFSTKSLFCFFSFSFLLSCFASRFTLSLTHTNMLCYWFPRPFVLFWARCREELDVGQGSNAVSARQREESHEKENENRQTEERGRETERNNRQIGTTQWCSNWTSAGVCSYG